MHGKIEIINIFSIFFFFWIKSVKLLKSIIGHSLKRRGCLFHFKSSEGFESRPKLLFLLSAQLFEVSRESDNSRILVVDDLPSSAVNQLLQLVS